MFLPEFFLEIELKSPPTVLFQIVDGKCKIVYSWPNDVTNAAVGILIISVLFIIPFIILVYCYVGILWMLSKRISTEISDSRVLNCKVESVTDLQKDKFQLARRNTVKTLLIVGCCFIICWSQNQIIYLMFNFGYELDLNSTYLHVTILMVFVNCTVNPFIYLIKYTDYQIALKAFLHCKTDQSDAYRGNNLETSNHRNTSNISI